MWRTFVAYVDHHINIDCHSIRRERKTIYEGFIKVDIWRTVRSSLSLVRWYKYVFC